LSDTIRIRRRVSGVAGPPSTLANAELAYNEIDNKLYYGKGDDGNGQATSIVSVGGSGAFQPLDPDLTAIAALTGINVIYYRSAADTWAAITIGTGLSFSSGTLSATATGSGNVSSSGTPTNGQLAQWTDATHIQGVTVASLGFAPLASPTFTGDPKAPTPATADNDTSIATTAFVKAQGYEVSINKGVANGYASLDATAKVPAAQLPSYVDDVVEYANLAAFPATGSTGIIYVALDTSKIYRWSGSAYVEISPSPGSTDAVPEGSTNLYYTEARVSANTTVVSKAPLASPVFTGNPQAPTPTAGDNDTSIATTAFVTTADNAVKSQLIGSASTGFDTLGEIENYIAANITPALGNKADIFSPTFTGDPKAPTPATADNDTSIATTAYVKSNLANYQPLDADLTALAALTGTNTIYYRSGVDTWSPVVVSTGLAFSGGNLTATGGGGGTPGGANTQVQFNDSGAFGGDADLTWNKTTNVLTLNGQLTQTGSANGIVAFGVVQANSYVCTGTIAQLSPASSGAIVLRPRGPTDSTNQLFIDIFGVTTNNPVTLPADPTSAMQAATKQYVDAKAPLGAEYITSITDATLTNERVLTDTATITWDRTTAGQIKANAAGGGGTSTTISDTPPGSPTAGSMWWESDTGTLWIYYNDGNTSQWVAVGGSSSVVPIAGPPQGRLTLQAATPVMTTTQAAKTTIYYSAFVGDKVPIYDGANWSMTTLPGGEISVATTDTTKSPAAIGVSKVNDWFVWNDAGTVRLGHGPDWTSDTARSAGTALVLVNGIWTNAVALTNGPAISRGTYVGTTRSNASSQLDWTLGTRAAGGGAASLNVWNAYNRVDVGTKVSDSTASWSYGVNTWRSANGSNTNRVSFVTGLAEDSPSCLYSVIVNGNAAGSLTGVGLDSTSSWSGTTAYVSLVGYQTPVAGNTAYPAQLGAHFFQAVEWGTVNSWLGDDGGANFGVGFMFRLRM